MKMGKLICAALLAALLTGCGGAGGSSSQSSAPVSSSPAPENESSEEIKLIQFEAPAKGSEIAVMKTTLGDIKIMFFPEEAPKTVENFVTHAKNGYYDGIKFHRVINGFMIQGGDPLGTGYGGESIWGEPFEDEFAANLYNFRGALSMANSGPNTNGSQFFIVQAKTPSVDAKTLEQAGYPKSLVEKYTEAGGTPHLDASLLRAVGRSGGHAVFGQVIEGMDVVDAIAAAETVPGDMPKTDILIESITFETVQ